MKVTLKSDDQLVAALALLDRRRAPYAEALAAVAADVFDRFPALPGPLLEIGAGAGQLRALLPISLRARAIHSEPSDAAARSLYTRARDATIMRANAETLPVATGVCGAVAGLCVFDAVADAGRAAAEIARVLAPGGRFVHLLDMATLLEAPFAKLVESGLVPIPNVFGDPGDHEWPLDVVLLKRDWLAGLLRFAAGAGHPFAATFAPIFVLFFDQSFDVATASGAFKVIAGKGDRRRALAAMLASASRLAVGQGHPPVSPSPSIPGGTFKACCRRPSPAPASRSSCRRSSRGRPAGPPTTTRRGSVTGACASGTSGWRASCRGGCSPRRPSRRPAKRSWSKRACSRSWRDAPLASW